MNLEKIVRNVAIDLLRLAVIRLPSDVKAALKYAYNQERYQIAKTQLKAILENIKIAEKTNSPLCQDTGLISFYLKAGSRFKGLDKIEDILYSAVRQATKKIPLRPNAIHFFNNINSNNNIGRHVPYIHWTITSGDSLDITVLPKGGGSENVSVLKMFSPNDGRRKFKKFIVDCVVEAGGMPCPPTILGVGMGGGANIAMELAKMALLNPLDKKNSDPYLADLELELHEEINKTGIGPMGLGGDTTNLAVKIEFAHRHPASYPIAVAFQCWASRRASARISSFGKIEYISHKENDIEKMQVSTCT